MSSKSVSTDFTAVSSESLGRPISHDPVLSSSGALRVGTSVDGAAGEWVGNRGASPTDDLAGVDGGNDDGTPTGDPVGDPAGDADGDSDDPRLGVSCGCVVIPRRGVAVVDGVISSTPVDD